MLGGEAEEESQAMPSGEAEQLERGVLSGDAVAKGRVIWSVNTRLQVPKEQTIFLTQTGTK